MRDRKKSSAPERCLILPSHNHGKTRVAREMLQVHLIPAVFPEPLNDGKRCSNPAPIPPHPLFFLKEVYF